MTGLLTPRLGQPALLKELVVVEALGRVDHPEEGVVRHGWMLAQVLLQGAEQLVQAGRCGAVLHPHGGHVLHGGQRPLVALQHTNTENT